jgi:hypothetical protein
MGICSGTMMACGTFVPATFWQVCIWKVLKSCFLDQLGIVSLKMHAQGMICSSLGKHFLSVWGGLVLWSTLGPGFA